MYDEFTRLEEAMCTLGFTDAEIAEVWRKAPKNKQRLEEPCVLIDPGPSKEGQIKHTTNNTNKHERLSQNSP
jgi:hypothetical protein